VSYKTHSTYRPQRPEWSEEVAAARRSEAKCARGEHSVAAVPAGRVVYAAFGRRRETGELYCPGCGVRLLPATEDVELVLAHLRARRRSHPESPVTRLNEMPRAYWQACIAQLRAAGHRISEVTCAGGDLAGNETGYVLSADRESRVDQERQDDASGR
jgi:hypothetical protein